MKKLSLISILIIVILFQVGCTQKVAGNKTTQINHPLVGTWILISSNNSSPEGQFFNLNKSNARQMKILNPTHFMYIQESVKGGKREFLSAAGGRYELDGNTYIESFDYASWEGYEDSYAIFTWRLEGNKWYHTGVLNNFEGEKYLIEEIWERIDEDPVINAQRN